MSAPIVRRQSVELHLGNQRFERVVDGIFVTPDTILTVAHLESTLLFSYNLKVVGFGFSFVIGVSRLKLVKLRHLGVSIDAMVIRLPFFQPSIRNITDCFADYINDDLKFRYFIMNRCQNSTVSPTLNNIFGEWTFVFVGHLNTIPGDCGNPLFNGGKVVGIHSGGNCMRLSSGHKIGDYCSIAQQVTKQDLLRALKLVSMVDDVWMSRI